MFIIGHLKNIESYPNTATLPMYFALPVLVNDVSQRNALQSSESCSSMKKSFLRSTSNLDFRGKHMGVSKNRGTPKWMIYNGNPY